MHTRNESTIRSVRRVAGVAWVTAGTYGMREGRGLQNPLKAAIEIRAVLRASKSIEGQLPAEVGGTGRFARSPWQQRPSAAVTERMEDFATHARDFVTLSVVLS